MRAVSSILACLGAAAALASSAQAEQVCRSPVPKLCAGLQLPKPPSDYRVHRVAYLGKSTDEHICTQWNDACGRTSTETSIPFVVSSCDVVPGTSTTDVFCTQYRNHGGTWDVSGNIAQTLALDELKPSDGQCNEVLAGFCALGGYSQELRLDGPQP